MSRVCFHVNRGKEFELGGSERAYAGGIVDSIGIAVAKSLGATGPWAWGQQVVPADHYLARMGKQEFDRSIDWSLKNDLRISTGATTTENAWVLNLNTAMRAGSNPVRLMARLHAQCEVHCFIRGANRKWLAGVIGEGCESKVLRRPWMALAEWLTTSAVDVVCSYSVCDGFPEYQQGSWKKQFSGLHPTLEIQPDNFESYHFGSGITWWDVAEYAETLRHPTAAI
jgi:hypothetical protein